MALAASSPGQYRPRMLSSAHNPVHRQLVEQSRQLLRDDDFDRAHQMYRALINAGTVDSDVHIAYAALLSKKGDVDGAHRHLVGHYMLNPVGKHPEGVAQGDARLLYARGLDKTYAMVGKGSDGRSVARLRGGHFTLQYLMKGDDTPRQRITFLPDSLLPAEMLPNHHLILNTISDVDIEAGSLRSLDLFLDRNPSERIINSPKVVLRTGRDTNYERLNGLHAIQFARTLKVTLDGSSADHLAKLVAHRGFNAPFIIREAGTHTGRTTELINSTVDLERYAKQPLSGEYYLINYIPVLWRSEFFRKMRLFIIDGEAYPVVCHFDRFWNVHGGNRLKIMKASEALMEQERSFLADWRAYVGKRAVEGIDNAIKATPLEFFGIDFTVTDSGDILIYELNASMRHSFDHAKSFTYKQKYDEATSEAFQKMVARHLRMASAAAP